MEFDGAEGAGEAGFTSVDRRVRGRANVKLAEGVKLNVDGVVGSALTDDLYFASLVLVEDYTSAWST